ncbi:PIN-like domain-containing protein [Nocardia sp. IFM 10818]
MNDDELAMMQQYSAWLTTPGVLSDDVREPFYIGNGIIVLDTNVLLSLYEYTATARDEVLDALELIGERLWLPHQVGLEFVRGRRRVIESRTAALKGAKSELDRKLQEIKTAYSNVSRYVENLLRTYAHDEQGAAKFSADLLADAEDQVSVWRKKARAEIEQIQLGQDIKVENLPVGDPVLARIAKIYGDRIGDPPSPDLVRSRVSDAIEYRFPNRIPPGFSDSGKGLSILAAGDYLMWSEVLDRAKELSSPRRVLIVSQDTKEDWYEPASVSSHGQSRPWPGLYDELRQCSDAALCIETPGDFYQGIKRFLNADLAEGTFEEIDRAVTIIPLDEELRTEEEIVTTMPSVTLLSDALSSVGLNFGIMQTVTQCSIYAQRNLQWWLIGMSADLGRREPTVGEPEVAVRAVVRSVDPPAQSWIPAEIFPLGSWPNPSSLWVAPWFAEVDKAVRGRYAAILRALAAQHAEYCANQ